jgi:hypothetical protein
MMGHTERSSVKEIGKGAIAVLSRPVRGIDGAAETTERRK